MKLYGYIVQSYWGPRRETPKSIARRFLRLIDGLAPIDPVFGQWICALDGKPILLEDLRNEMTEVVERHVSRTDDGEPEPIYGYTAAVVNTLESTPRSFAIYAHAGAWHDGHFYINSVDIETSRREVPDPAIVTYTIFRSALLVLAETFDVTWCSAYPRDIMLLWKDEIFRLGWMSYVSPRFAPLITPPKSAIVEYRPNGALFMAATDETFVTSNPEHLAVAREIRAAIAPLNDLPWPPDAEPE
jgi:hypothetical protein